MSRELCRSFALFGAAVLFATSARAADSAEACENASQRSQRLRAEHRLVEARDELLTCAVDSCPAVVRKDCEAWLLEVDANVPTVVLGARDEHGRDVEALEVSIDDRVRLAHVDGKAQRLDPGPHLLRFVLNGEAREERVVLREGEKNRPIVVTFEATKAMGPKPESPRVESGSRLTTPTLVFGSVAGLAFVTFAVAGGLAVSEYGELRDGCGKDGACAGRDLEPVRQKMAIADVALGVGLVSTAAAVVFFFAAPSGAARSQVLSHGPGFRF